MLTIYIAEDHTAIRELLVNHLSMLPGYKVVGQTADGSRVVAECRQLNPQLLILDLALPGLGGIEVARAMAKELPEVATLVFTSNHNAAIVRQVMEVGVQGMVEKSAPFDTLMKAIDTVGAGRMFFGDAVTQALHESFLNPPAAAATDSLTDREREVLQLVAEGRSNKEVCSQLGISLRTAENHRHNIMRKLDAHNGADLTRAAFRLGLVRSEGAPPAP